MHYAAILKIASASMGRLGCAAQASRKRLEPHVDSSVKNIQTAHSDRANATDGNELEINASTT